MNMNGIKQRLKRALPKEAAYVRAYLCDYAHTTRAWVNTITEKGKEHVKAPNIKFYSDEEVVNLILDKGYSLSRFGDGEFQWMTGEERIGFQHPSKELAERLKEVFLSETDGLLVGIPKGVIDSSKNNLYAKMYWRIIRENYLPKLLKLTQMEKRRYADASITRPYIDYHSRKESKKRFDNLKRIWDKRHIVIVEGQGTRLGVGNDLLSNASEIERILCPSVDAFFKLEEIEHKICAAVSKEALILAALGPSATILAYDMCRRGYQVVDIGHIDVEYIWFLRHDRFRKPIEGKSVSEVGALRFNTALDCGEEYQKSIIAVIE